MVEVYISFNRREDKVRYSFISHLSAAFHRRGISSYIGGGDGSDPESNGSSKQCLENSRACVVVFSEKYLSSKPCLEDLVKISGRRRNDDGFAVVPVFYAATKSSVKKQIWRRSRQLKTESRNALLEAVELPGYGSYVAQREVMKEKQSEVPNKRRRQSLRIRMKTKKGKKTKKTTPVREPSVVSLSASPSPENEDMAGPSSEV
ncbi:unnamed protein product [Eruca vesicaria subsp. sativa]|uniref:TIR domain-containing protein n=1 Tax=Eruca vesicaria subsp. sativa TaxID=29727 RepID=A0ABC8KIJ5_ERUVS|nr:unnamed protein product [Eruca vesicaria subsp. sativa]